jgi:hypothetical protein
MEKKTNRFQLSYVNAVHRPPCWQIDSYLKRDSNVVFVPLQSLNFLVLENIVEDLLMPSSTALLRLDGSSALIPVV